jgi:hypothetical protein
MQALTGAGEKAGRRPLTPDIKFDIVTFLLLHLFAKKCQATPRKEVDTAKRRLADYEKRAKT